MLYLTDKRYYALGPGDVFNIQVFYELRLSQARKHHWVQTPINEANLTSALRARGRCSGSLGITEALREMW